eukprot:jgi/Orpsp1_1/1182764/evm.model.c7180000082597.1
MENNLQNSPKKNPLEGRKHVRMNAPPPSTHNLNLNNLRQYKRGNNQMAFIHQVNKNPISDEELRSRLSKKYTMEEVEKHNTAEDCWMVFNNTVYNVTEYLNFHPGGKSILMTCAGKDGTSMFYKCHPWVDINSLLKNYTIGTLSR